MALDKYTLAYQAWERAGRMGEPPQRPRELVRTWLACPYAGLNRTGESPVPGSISQRSSALLAVYKSVRSLTATERRSRAIQRQRPHFDRLTGQLATEQYT